MIKIAMVKIFSHLTAHSSKLILQVHDELVLECPKSEVETTKQIIEAEMVAALELSVPVKIEVGIGASWAGAKA